MQSRLHLDFGLAVLSSLLRGRLSFPGAHLPTSGHKLADAFFGVGVAAARDPAVDEFIIECLGDLGVRYVRIDVAPGDECGPTCRLLESLCGQGFKIAMHLIQPRCAAQRMPSPEAESDWKDFVAGMLERFGEQIEMVEIGSTVNRKRWTGHSLAGFLSMWEVAWREVRARRLTLAGPSVTDFEPPWNIGILNLLKKRGQLPDIHTDNLFSERCSEPERFDHKILGRNCAPWHKYNLIKKARLLARLGAEHGVPRLASPAAFWTLPRIARVHPNSEQKQADYLVRYLVLAAASGALESAWWGALICHREGLIDNGQRPYPVLERITHYASVEGGRDELRKRPAYFAFRCLVTMLQGATYESSHALTYGLEIHSFLHETTRVHVAWTVNGKAAALCDLYDEDDLDNAEVLDRDGNCLDKPPCPLSLIVSEAPVFLRWPIGRPVQLRRGAALLRDVCIARHATNLCHFHFRDDNWQGIVLARDATDACLLLEKLHPDRIAPPRRKEALRFARNAIWTIQDPRGGEGDLVVKKPVKMHLHKRLLDRFKPSKALRSWNGTCELLRRGVEAAGPVAYFEKRSTDVKQNYYICEKVQTALSARELISAFSNVDGHFLGLPAKDAFQLLADFILTMHGRGIFFRDLAGGNILVERVATGQLNFVLIDTGRIHAYDHPLTLEKRVSDLVRICNKMNRAGRDCFLDQYMSKLGRGLSWRQLLAFKLYDAKVHAKRRFGRKAIKQLYRRLSGD